MKLTCPSCGAIASAEAWSNDARWRELLQVVASLPAPLPPMALHYLSLFRPGKSALSPSRALRLSRELRALVACGYVSEKGKVDRPCDPYLWARGIEEMIDRKDRLERPMPNHNYLRRVVYSLADQADAHQERRQNESILRGDRRRVEPVDDGMSEIMRKAIAASGGQHGTKQE